MPTQIVAYDLASPNAMNVIQIGTVVSIIAIRLPTISHSFAPKISPIGLQMNARVAINLMKKVSLEFMSW